MGGKGCKVFIQRDEPIVNLYKCTVLAKSDVRRGFLHNINDTSGSIKQSCYKEKKNTLNLFKVFKMTQLFGKKGNLSIQPLINVGLQFKMKLEVAGL